MRRQANRNSPSRQWRPALASGARFEREVHDEPRWSGCPVVHDPQPEPRGDLTDLVAIVGIDARCLAIVEYQRWLAVQPARTLIDLGPDHPQSEEAVDRRGLAW